MRLNEKQLEEILKEVKPSIIESLKTEIKESITHQVVYSAKGIIGNYIEKWIAENVIPEIEKTLIERRKGLVSIGITLAEELTVELSKALTAELKEKLSKSYSRSKIMEALFN